MTLRSNGIAALLTVVMCASSTAVAQAFPPSRVPSKSDALRRDLAEASAEAGRPARHPFGASQSDADTKEIASYRLTMPALKKVAAVTRALAAELRQDPKFQELQKIEAELEALGKKEELTEAEEARVEKLRERQEAIEDSTDSPLDSGQTLSDMEAQIRRTPALANALKREGMTPREYGTFWLAFFQAAMIHGLQKSGLSLKELPAGVNAENVKFIADHASEIEGLQKEFESLGKPKT